MGLLVGPALLLLLLVFPVAGLPAPAARLAAVLALVLTWWITEAIPIPMTAVLGAALAVVCGVGTAGEMFAPFGDPVVFLFLGSFLLAGAMAQTGLDRRFVLALLSVPRAGASPFRILALFGLGVAGLSLWLSNTATAAMVLPVAVGTLSVLSPWLGQEPGRSRYAASLMLVVAYSASIGGVATPVGSPPNLIVLGQLRTLGGVSLSFFQWMALGLPVAAVLMAVLLLLSRRGARTAAVDGTGFRAFVASERARLGPWTREEVHTLVAFGIAVVLWVLPGVLTLALGATHPAVGALQAHVPEAVVAMLAASLLFLPIRREAGRHSTVSWSLAARVDWGTLLLFGGGLSLGAALFRTGLATAVGDGLVAWTGARSLTALTFLFGALAIVLTEAISNTATATMVCPLAIAAAQSAGVSPVAPAVTVALQCSMAFMLPVSTPPNAIVYGTGRVTIVQMIRRGITLDLAALAVIPPLVLGLCHAMGL